MTTYNHTNHSKKLKYPTSLDQTPANDIFSPSLYHIPPRQGRYIVLDTETTGLNRIDHVVEIGAIEIINGKLTGSQFHIYIKPRIEMCDEVIGIHGITNNFYDNFYKNIYVNDKKNLENFLKFVGNSLIFAHNASFDLNAINVELKFWGLNELPIKKFRCSMKMFKDIIGKKEKKFYDKYVCLEKCCEYFGLKATNSMFHNALFDAFMTARMICKLYELIEKDNNLKKEIKYNNQKNFLSKNSNNNFNNIKVNQNYLGNKRNFEKIDEKNDSTCSTGELDESSQKNKEEEKEENILDGKIIDEIFNELTN